jgi:cell division protein FtsW
MKHSGDRVFATIVLILVITGIALFSSATLGLLARAGSSPWSLVVSQFVLGLIPGIIALVFFRFLPQKRLAQIILPFYILTLVLLALVFVPGVGASYNGAHRWINLGFATFQPSEFVKISVILMLSSYLAHAKGTLQNIRKGLVPFGVIVGIPCVFLLLQPNTSTVLIIGATCAALYYVAGAPWRDFAIMAVVSAILLSALILTRPYLMNRVKTFVNPSHNAQTTGYHIQQSLIAIGSGGFLGRGFGQSVQKFNYLPEAESDSVFAVFGEEFGFFGTVLLVLLFVAFAMRGLMIASEAASTFGALTVTGLTLLISCSAFLNIGALLGVLPLTGLPLPFISHGGTALAAALASVGIILNIASRRKL